LIGYIPTAAHRITGAAVSFIEPQRLAEN